MVPNQRLTTHNQKKTYQKTYPKEYTTRHQEVYQENQRGRQEQNTKVSKIVKFKQDPIIKTFNPDHPPNKIGKSKIDSIESTLHTQGTHIAGITETHLTSGESINIPGYEWKGKERINQDGGGIRTDIINMIDVWYYFRGGGGVRGGDTSQVTPACS